MRKWKFETWNEPDHGDFCDLEFDVESFKRYFDLSLTAVKTAVPGLKLQVTKNFMFPLIHIMQKF